MSELPATTAQVTPPPTFANLEKPAAPPVVTPPDAPPATDPKVETLPKDPPAADPKVETPPKTEETPPKEQEKEKPVVPEKYDLKLSEKSLLDKSAIDRIAAYAKAQGLSQADAQSVVKAQEEDVAAFIEDRKAEWKAQSLSDKEIGGDALNENIQVANRALDKYASPNLKAELTKTGYGNHPEMVRMLVKIGRAMQDDKAFVPRTHSTSVRSVQDVMYDNPKSKT